MSRRHYSAFAVLFAALFAAPARADSPEIFCDPPLKPIAATICATPCLMSLDHAFSTALEKSVQRASRPDDDPDPDPGPIKTAYLEDWGRACPPASADAATCIADHYRRGLAKFQAAANAAAGICRKFAARYAIAIGKSNTGLPQSDDGLAYPLERMRDTQRSGVLIERRLQMSAVDALDLPDWARRAIAAFHITDKVGVALAESLRDEKNSDFSPSALHLPGTAIFATATIHSTASCRIVTFRLRGAKKTPLPGPTNWHNNDCSNDLEFGAIDGVPVVFGSRGEREALQDRLTLSPWDGRGFAPYCEIVFRYAPILTVIEDPQWQPSRAATIPKQYFRDALEFVAAARRGDNDARIQAGTTLNAEQRAFFDPPRKISENNSVSTAVAEPLALIYARDGEVYRMTLAPLDPLNRSAPDWRVNLEKSENGDWSEIARFATRQGKGAVIEVQIE